MEDARSNQKASTKLSLLVFVIAFNAMVVLGAAISQLVIVTAHSWQVFVPLVLMLSAIAMRRALGEKLTLAYCDMMALFSAALFGPSAAVIMAATSRVLVCAVSKKSYRDSLFKAAACAASMNAACYATLAALHSFGNRAASMSAIEIVAASALCAVCYFVLSTSLIAGYESFANDESFFELVQASFMWTSMRLLVSAPSAFRVYLMRQLNYDESRPHRRMRMGEILVARGHISKSDLMMALESQRRSVQPAMRVGEILIQMGLVEERYVMEAVASSRGPVFSAA